MWRGPVVQARKNAVNAAKWKVFSLHAKLIAIAAQKWADPDENPSLAAAIAKARKQWVPNDNITRAIKKWSGDDANAIQISEIVYEWYATWWIALMVSTLTDNKNRTVSNIRHIFSKYGWNLGENGSVSWMFEKKWVLFVSESSLSLEDAEMHAIEAGAQDVFLESGYIKILCDTADYSDIEKYFEWQEVEIYESKLDYTPNNEMEITDFDTALKFTKMLEAFDADEDSTHLDTLARKRAKELLRNTTTKLKEGLSLQNTLKKEDYLILGY